MCSILKCKDAIQFFSERNDAFNILIQSITKIEEAIKVLATVHEITKMVQRKNCTLSDFYGACIVMERKQNKMNAKRNKETDLAQCLLSSFESRKKFFKNEAIICAVYLDRRFSGTLSAEETEFTKKALHRLYKRVCETMPTEISNTDDAINNDSDFDIDKYLIEKGCQPIEDVAQVVQEESKMFNQQMNESEFLIMLDEFERTTQRLHYTTEIVLFWKQQKHVFPELYLLSTILNSVPPAQDASQHFLLSMIVVDATYQWNI